MRWALACHRPQDQPIPSRGFALEPNLDGQNPWPRPTSQGTAPTTEPDVGAGPGFQMLPWSWWCAQHQNSSLSWEATAVFSQGKHGNLYQML